MIFGTKPRDGITRDNPFPRGTGGSNSFRIPALVTLPDSTLVAAADARWNATFDGGGLDTIVSRSRDGGKTWQYRFANYLGDNGNVYNGSRSTCFIDPSLAVDGDGTMYMLTDLYPYGVALNGIGNTQPVNATGFDERGRLLLSRDDHKSYDCYLEDGALWYSDGQRIPEWQVDGFFNLYRNGERVSNLFFADSPYKVTRTGFLYLTKSVDGGVTWSEPKLLNCKRGREPVCLVAPGRGLVTAKGRWVFPVYSYGGSPESQKTSFLYSDDGVTWYRSADFEGAAWSSESACMELDDGTLRFFYRNGTAALCYADYDLKKDIWGEAVCTGIPTNSNCQISAIRYSKPLAGKPVILVSCPAGPNAAGSNITHADYRRNGRIFAFTQEPCGALRRIGTIAVTEPEGQFMYSCLTECTDGSLAILCEDRESRWGVGEDCYYTIAFRKYDLSEVLGLSFDKCNP